MRATAYKDQYIDAFERGLAQEFTTEYVHGLEVGTALWHPENSHVVQPEKDITRYSWKHAVALGGLARDAFNFGIGAASEHPLREVNLDLGEDK